MFFSGSSRRSAAAFAFNGETAEHGFDNCVRNLLCCKGAAVKGGLCRSSYDGLQCFGLGWGVNEYKLAPSPRCKLQGAKDQVGERAPLHLGYKRQMCGTERI